jgi:seryl-tRNA synthetase
MPHHEVLLRLDAMDLERGAWFLHVPPFYFSLLGSVGAKIAGHRGYFLTNDGIDLNQALISYGLDFLRKKGYKKVMPPFFMNKDQMAKTAQLDEFDEALYKAWRQPCFTAMTPLTYAGDIRSSRTTMRST